MECPRARRYVALRRVAGLTASLVVTSGCSALGGAARGTSSPTLTDTVAELQMHLQIDTYRTSHHIRATDRNVFDDVLKRLDRLQAQAETQERASASEGAVISFARGRALERLRRYEEAAVAFAHVASTPNALRDAAAHSHGVMALFGAHVAAARAAADTPASRDPAYIRAWVGQWTALAEASSGTAYESLALEEAEAWDQAYVEILVSRGDTEAGLRACHQLIAHHRDSKSYPGHLIRLGDLYAETLRRRHVSVLARRVEFDARAYERDLERAFSAYQMAAEARVPRLRKLAEMKIQALLAYHEGVQSDVP
jgi:tetratricopeptide (TPR) repeat protein